MSTFELSSRQGPHYGTLLPTVVLKNGDNIYFPGVFVRDSKGCAQAIPEPRFSFFLQSLAQRSRPNTIVIMDRVPDHEEQRWQFHDIEPIDITAILAESQNQKGALLQLSGTVILNFDSNLTAKMFRLLFVNTVARTKQLQVELMPVEDVETCKYFLCFPYGYTIRQSNIQELRFSPIEASQTPTKINSFVLNESDTEESFVFETTLTE